MMYKVVAVVKPFKVDEIVDRLLEAGINGLTLNDCKGFGRQKGHTEMFRGAEYIVDFLPKVRVEVYALQGQLTGILSALEAAARTGRIGDGKIWVERIEEAVRIRTGERGRECLGQLALK